MVSQVTEKPIVALNACKLLFNLSKIPENDSAFRDENIIGASAPRVSHAHISTVLPDELFATVSKRLAKGLMESDLGGQVMDLLIYAVGVLKNIIADKRNLLHASKMNAVTRYHFFDF